MAMREFFNYSNNEREIRIDLWMTGQFYNNPNENELEFVKANNTACQKSITILRAVADFVLGVMYLKHAITEHVKK